MSNRRNRSSPVLSTPIDDTDYEPLDEAGVVPPNSAVLSSPRSNTNILTSSTPRYNSNLASTPRIVSKSVKVETIPGIYTPKPELLRTDVLLVEKKVEPEDENPVDVYLADKFQDDNVVENELLKNGYTVVNKIMLDERGVQQCAYIKCYNQLGQPLLVELDAVGVVLESNKDLTMFKTASGFSRNYSLRVGEAECSKLSGCNLGFVCTDGVCILETDESGETKEHNFEFVKKFAEREVVIDDDAVAVPIVHLSDIRANNKLVMKKVNEMTEKLRNNAFKFALESLRSTRDKLAATNSSFNTYVNVEKVQQNRLMESIKQLKQFSVAFYKKHIECPTGLAAIEMEKHKEVIANLTLRSAKISEMLKSVRAVNMIQKQLDEMKLELDSATEFLKQEFEHVDKAYVL